MNKGQNWRNLELNGAKRHWHSVAGKSHAFCRRATESGSARPVPGQLDNRRPHH